MSAVPERAMVERAVKASQRAALASWVLTALNVLNILFVTTVVGPKMDSISERMEANRQMMVNNRGLAEEIREDITLTKRVADRLNDVLDQAVGRAKAAEKARQDEEAKKAKEKKP